MVYKDWNMLGWEWTHPFLLPCWHLAPVMSKATMPTSASHTGQFRIGSRWTYMGGMELNSDLGKWGYRLVPLLMEWGKLGREKELNFLWVAEFWALEQLWVSLFHMFYARAETLLTPLSSAWGRDIYHLHKRSVVRPGTFLIPLLHSMKKLIFICFFPYWFCSVSTFWIT